MTGRIFFTTAFFCLWLLPSGVSAAPFCVEAQGLPAECWYYDARSCRQEAIRRNGRCSANLEEVTLPDQGAPFCIVDSGLVPVCSYQNGEDCNAMASARNAVCFENVGSGTGRQDPYMFERSPYQF